MNGPHRSLLSAVLLASLLPGVVLATGPIGNKVRPEDLEPSDLWVTEYEPDPRCEVSVPVNVVRIYSDEHAAEEMAPEKWITTHMSIANQLFRLSDGDLADSKDGLRPQMIQFTLNHVYDVHEKEVSEMLGFEMDTEEVPGAPASSNGLSRAGAADLRTLKVTDEEELLTVYCVWSIRNRVHEANEVGGQSNVGFADRPATGPRRVLSKVTGVPATLGVILSRREGTWMNTLAHELGHFFSLPHAWDRESNAALGITDLGNGPQGDVDEQSGLANVMDYENGDGISQYFTLSQLAVMYRFAVEKASRYVRATRATPGAPPPVKRSVSIQRAWVSGAEGKEDLVVHVATTMKGCVGEEALVFAWFTDQDGHDLRDCDGKYAFRGGEVGCWCTVTPASSPETNDDISFSIPAAQLHLGPGSHHILMHCGVVVAGHSEAVGEVVGLDIKVPDRSEKIADGKPMVRFTVGRAEVVEIDDKPWLRVWADWEQANLLHKEVSAQILYYFEDGTPLRDFDGKYCRSDGFVATGWKGRVDSRVLKGLITAIPCEQLHLSPGEYDLLAGITIEAEGHVLASARTETVHVRVAEPKHVASVTIKKVWVTYDWFDGTEYGLLVHTSLTISGYRGQKVLVCAYFETDGGESLKDLDGNYATATGAVAAARDVTPSYDDSAFEDHAVYIPYSQLHLAPGEHHLQATIQLHLNDKEVGSPSEPVEFSLIRK